MPPIQTNSPATASALSKQLDRLRTGRLLCSLGIAIGGVYAYSYRFGISPDGVSYLDVAGAYMRHDWGMAINGWWSPLYSWILAIFFSVFRPTSSTELPLLHIVNFLCFAWTAWSFHRFWQALLDSARESDSQLAALPGLAPIALDLFGYGLFFFLFWPLIATPTPDVLSAAFIFLISERLLRWQARGPATLRDGLVLGLLFALGYLTKTILFYFSVAALVVAFFDRRSFSRRALLASALVFILLIVPWLVALHHTFGGWTLGFSGPLNYAWFVDGTVTGTYPGPAGAPLPYFPGPKVLAQPPTYQVATQPNITYVPWYDPARFDKSDHPYFRWSGQIAALEKNLVWLRDWLFLHLGAMTVVVLALFFACGRTAGRMLARCSTIALPTLLLFALYSLVLIRTPRYVAAITVVAFALLLASVRLAPVNRSLASAVLASGLIIFTVINLPGIIDAFAGLSDHHPSPMIEIAEGLRQAGMQPNSHVASVGAGVYAYWAQLARVNIAAEIWDENAPLFWNEPSAERSPVLCAMSKAGAVAVVGQPASNVDLSGWQPLGKSGYWMRRISAQECAAMTS